MAPALPPAVCACVSAIVGAHAEITPVSDEKMNGVDCWLILKSGVPLNTIPVGLPPGIDTISGPPGGGGVGLGGGEGLPSPSYSVLLSVPLFAIQTKAFGLNAMPQGLTSLESV